MFWMQVLLAFILGIVANKVWNSFLSVGYSVLLFKQLQDDSVKIMGSTAQLIAEIQQIKQMELYKAGKSAQEIEIASSVSDYYFKPLKEALVKNFINSFPPIYKSILKFYDWDSAMEHLDGLINKEKLNQQKMEK